LELEKVDGQEDRHSVDDTGEKKGVKKFGSS